MEAGYGLTESAYNPNDGDATLAVKFEKRPVENKTRTLAEGRPIFEEVDFITIEQPGNKDEVRDHKVRQNDINRFPEHWKRYKARTDNEEALTGTPLSEWPQISRSQVEELTFYHVRTVEQLAAVTDANLQNMMGGVVMKQKARAFLEQATSNDELSKQLAAQKKQIDALMAAAEARDEPKQKRVRRTKEQIEEDNGNSTTVTE